MIYLVILHGLCPFEHFNLFVCVILYVCVLFVMYCVVLYGLGCAWLCLCMFFFLLLTCVRLCFVRDVLIELLCGL